MTPKKFSKTLLNWYNKHGRKNLPWHKNINPYRVWISEIMLQQTQVTTVIPYFKKFIKTFPNIKSLAIADQDQVLNLWTGLGYYSRARNLHRTANIIMEKFRGKFPDDLETLQTLPGIGRSTAGAILAISMNQATSILDGNVKRVLTRFHAIEGWPGLPAVEKKLWQIATDSTPSSQAADYTQAIMDLGATICIRSKPLCQHCPLQKNCAAYTLGRQQEFPYKNSKKKNLPVRQTHMLLLRNKENAILLQKRPPTGIWGGLWSFPETTQNDYSSWCKKNNLQIKQIQAQPSFRHTFSHFHLDITPVLVDVDIQKNTVMDSANQIWYKPDLKFSIGMATPVKNLLEQLFGES